MYQFSVHNDIGSPLIEWLHLKPPIGVQTHFPTALIGGAVGGGIAVGLVIIGLIFLVKKMRISGFTKERETVGRRKREHSRQQQDDDEAGDNGFGTDSSSCKAAQTYEELSMKTDTSVYDALKKGENGQDNSQVYTALDESNSTSQNYYGNVKKEDPVYNNTVL
ncbi:uncharacterized protein LOC128234976 [Mya arenaria]|uniref:uncharacterized protein LOC128234976 n=1 Tax=Mya arenaria TaxID=6604 RepID=UPI0022E7E0C3|nr:uncharacterized protein LOC128234976 [Mya arenaria]